MPVLYSAARGVGDRLPVRGMLIGHDMENAVDRARSAEIAPGDIVVLVSDGLTESGRLEDAFGYRFVQTIEKHAGESALAIGDRILKDWRAHPRSLDWIDDVTLVVAVVRPQER
jgi:serine phosphatase RsbU (regulator of sigma subunit)